ncbi:hypothetical protein [Kitasatospora kifunensis]|uniref:Gram-positive cocci surface proteins LPxTG domain-containing protein n=1 Tax=Kitasatospora kifunensis TaxID=58351 RepID=A0A7W7R5Q2_KITKI|nr:hypothetical protein [Kitasatospora kifunensis]MBB4925937.1 hypothetical protein [Kitasatospora kifunensis]
MLSAARPVHRAAVVLAATALAALPVPALADTPDTGRASAVTAELNLDVSLLNNAVDVPVDIALNKVQSPAQAHGSMLSATVAGVAQPGPITLVKADVGNSVTQVDAQGAKASVQLVNADVNAPGLPGNALLGLQALSSSVSCPVDGQPTATVTAPAKLTVLGHSVTLRLDGPTHVDIPAIGGVDIDFSPRSTTSTSAAAAALTVRVALNPLNLNVAKVSGTITVASVSCQKPTGASGEPSGSAVPSAPASVSAPSAAPSAATGASGAPSAAGASGTPVAGAPVAQVAAAGGGSSAPGTAAPSAAASGGAVSSAASGKRSGAASSLAFTGTTSTVPLLAGGSALLLAGAATVLLARRRRAAHRR